MKSFLKTIGFILFILFIWYLALLILVLPDIHLWNFWDIFLYIENFNPVEVSKKITIENKDLWDSFNIFNSLVGIFTIILVYFTYKTQKEELRITNETFKKQKEIMEEEKFYNQLNFLIQQKERIKQLIAITQSIYKNGVEMQQNKYYWSLAISKYIN